MFGAGLTQWSMTDLTHSHLTSITNATATVALQFWLQLEQFILDCDYEAINLILYQSI